jgi:aminoglycoside phosphotransferase (APT) family kinase protein
MTDKATALPSLETIGKLLAIIQPGSRPRAVLPVEGENSNYTHIVEATSAAGEPFRMVMRRYKIFGNYDRGEKARREFAALKFAHEHGIPTPKPLYLDWSGAILGSPGIVTAYIDGRPDLTPEDPAAYARALAGTLARIHGLPCAIPDGSFILDADREATWFLNSGRSREVIGAHPLGPALLEAAEKLYPELERTHKSVVHIDYWPGNILWKKGEIVGVVDWEEAAYGDPIIDVAYCRMELSISGLSGAADTLLCEYTRLTKRAAANLLFWELAACARPLFSPETWRLTQELRAENLAQFILELLRKATG